MPVMHNYKLDFEVSVSVRDQTTGLLITKIAVGGDAKANSYNSEEMITATVNRRMREFALRVSDHMETVEAHEAKRT